MLKTGFENLRVYQLALELAEAIWQVVAQWDFMAKDTVGKQVVRAADSVGANIAEGSGRGSVAENRRFAKIARGSLFEVKHWIRLAATRNLLSAKEKQNIETILNELLPKLSNYIKAIDGR
jgi:four helix bundle protein